MWESSRMNEWMTMLKTGGSWYYEVLLQDQ